MHRMECVLLSVFCLVLVATQLLYTAGGKLKALCLHGYQINGRIFQHQLSSLVDRCSDKYEFVFADGPHLFRFRYAVQHLTLSAEPEEEEEEALQKRQSKRKRRWWRTVESSTFGTDAGSTDESSALDKIDLVEYEGLAESLQYISDIEASYGPFDVIIGHSQGACLTILLDLLRNNHDSLLDDIMMRKTLEIDKSEEEIRKIARLRLPQSKLSIVLSGFIPRDITVRNALDSMKASDEKSHVLEPIVGKSLHVFSAEDNVLPFEESVGAMGLYKHPVMVIHNGGHNPPFDTSTEDKICRRLEELYDFHYGVQLQLEP